MALHLQKKVIPSQSSSQTTSNDAVLQDPASSDLPAISFDSSEDEDESNGQFQKRNLIQSLQHNPSHIPPPPPLTRFRYRQRAELQVERNPILITN